MVPQDTIDLVRRRANDPKTRTDQMDVVVSKVRPVVDAQAIDAAEALIGSTLPPTLRRLYLEIGDGGFGPGYGLLPLGLDSKSGDESIVALYRDFSTADPEDPSWNWPRGLLPIAHMGCAIYPCIRLTDSKIIVFDPNLHDTNWAQSFLDQQCTLEEWVHSWCAGEDLWKKIYDDRVA